MTVFYFTATGNSLYVAKKLGGKLVSIPQVLKSNNSIYKDDVIGIVYPCYAGGIPRIVKRFVDKVKIEADYTFAVMTYGNEHTSALHQMGKYVEKQSVRSNYINFIPIVNNNYPMFQQMGKYAEKQSIRFDYMNYILMVNNYLPMFKVEDEINKVPQKGIENAISAIAYDIKSKKSFIPLTSISNKFWGAVFRLNINKMTGGNADQRLIVDSACTLCGTCSKVCPVNNISVNDNLVFKHQCEGCLACIHHCPVGAIHINGEKSIKRFCNENIKLDEIIMANNHF
jgi:ferredoxin